MLVSARLDTLGDLLLSVPSFGLLMCIPGRNAAHRQVGSSCTILWETVHTKGVKALLCAFSGSESRAVKTVNDTYQ